MALHTDARIKRVDLTLDEAKELLNRAVEERGRTYIYQSPVEGACVYFDPEGGCPSCLVGHVLAYKGFSLDDFSPGSNINRWEVAQLVESGFLLVDDETQTLLTIAQTEQDDGMTWGRAVEEALATYEEKTEYEDEDLSGAL